MKNHWLQLYKKRQNKYWTAEFLSNSTYILSPRRVDLSNKDSKDNFDIFNGKIGIIFKNAIHMTGDQQLQSFFLNCTKNIKNWFTRLYKYEQLKQIEFYELHDLSFCSLGLNENFDDLILIFEYEKVTHN